jgi:ribulose 1,5-bisphosphate synthetase/thiazole synthase
LSEVKKKIMKKIDEKIYKLPVSGEYDVIVAGGGFGGIAAAIASARAGADTLLVERNSFVGGVATAGMCCSIFNCYYTSEHELGVHGIAVEVADKLAAAMGYGKVWHQHKGHVIYDLELGKLVLQEMLEDAGVNILLNTVISDCIVEGDTLKGIIIESKSGREALRAKNIVDATGDADVAYLSGAPVHMPKQNAGLHSLCFRLGNVDVEDFINYFREHPEQYPEMMDVEWTLEEALAQYDECGTFLFPHGGGMQMDAFKQAIASGELPDHVGMHDTTNACQMHGMKQTGMVHVITGFAHFDGLDNTKISHSINDGRKMAYKIAEVFRKYLPGFRKAFVAGVAANLGIRSSRWLDGDFVYKSEMFNPGVRFDDAVGTFVVYKEKVLHSGKKAWAAQVMTDNTADLPLRCLLPKKLNGLIMGSGRSISAENPWILRVMVDTMVIGQAAGVAAAVAGCNKLTVNQVDVALIQKELINQGVKLKTPPEEK